MVIVALLPWWMTSLLWKLTFLIRYEPLLTVPMQKVLPSRSSSMKKRLPLISKLVEVAVASSSAESQSISSRCNLYMVLLVNMTSPVGRL